MHRILKSCFQNTEPKLLNHRDFKSFSLRAFEEDFSEALIDCSDSYDNETSIDCCDSYDKFENIFTSKLNKHMLLEKENGLTAIVNPI